MKQTILGDIERNDVWTHYEESCSSDEEIVMKWRSNGRHGQVGVHDTWIRSERIVGGNTVCLEHC